MDLDQELYDMIVQPIDNQHLEKLKTAKSEHNSIEIQNSFLLDPKNLKPGIIPDFGTLIVPLDDKNFLHLNKWDFRLRSGSAGKFSRDQLLLKRKNDFPIFSKAGQIKPVQNLNISGRLGNNGYSDTLQGFKATAGRT